MSHLKLVGLTFSNILLLVGQPFDLTKTRLQTAQPGQYSGTMDVVRRTFAKDGVSGFAQFIFSFESDAMLKGKMITAPSSINNSFYRGMSSPLAGVTPMFAVSFWVSPSHIS
jgi:solute carrier family 25 carnitine/acylcarnitine transporter 20/29